MFIINLKGIQSFVVPPVESKQDTITVSIELRTSLYWIKVELKGAANINN